MSYQNSRSAFAKGAVVRTPCATRQHRGRMSYHAGVAAENRIAMDYERRGYTIDRRRWSGQGGEVDLIVRDAEGLIFVEVKQSRSFDRAAHSLSRRQMQRIYRAAEEYIGFEPTGSLTNVRFDVALLNANGETRIIENAFGGF